MINKAEEYNTSGNPGDDSMRQRYLTLVLIALLFTIADVSATNDVSEIVGPYKVSFSLPDNINVTANKEIEDGETYSGISFTLYTLRLNDSLDNYPIATFKVYQYEIKLNPDLTAEAAHLVDKVKSLGYISVSGYNREIDHHPGYLIVADETLDLSVFHEGGYFIDNMTFVNAVSYLPWDDGTLQLLKTLHVEKVE